METEHKLIDKLAWIEIQNRNILCTLSKGKDIFYIPGGKREPGESDAEALIREIREELSVDLEVETLNFLGKFEAQAHGKAAGVTVQMQCYKGNYKGELKPDSEIEEIEWLNSTDLEKVSHVDKIIFNWLKERDWID